MSAMLLKRASREVDTPPIMEINMTPLIDVMLVLIIMVIITIPIQSHAVKMDLPGPLPATYINQQRNQLVITANGAFLWNGQAVSRNELQALLAATANIATAPELHLRPDAMAPYAVVDDVLSMTKRAQVAKVGFVGNEAYAGF